ncbi:MAG TPA: SET domain-containing protein-lysine N-methyltransferase [Chitinophagaceae bacterium]|nr:SET domain-containing protein-lysine N-methyltransferase [Chitinophagaceae bacterium]
MLTNPSLAPTGSILYSNEFAEARQDSTTGHKSLHSTLYFNPGDVITSFRAGLVSTEATYLTIQIDTGKHITLKPDCLAMVNHSCLPNCFFNTTSMELLCIRPIKPGDEFCFFYPSTEWEMAQPFKCFCGSSNCLHYISGAADIKPAILEKYHLTDFIKKQLGYRF